MGNSASSLAAPSGPAAPASRDTLKIILDGPPACGKGTQSEFIERLTGVVHISTGDALRYEVKTGTELGKKAKAYMDKGALVPDELVIDICKKRLLGNDCISKGWLLDGFPRTGVQAKALKDSGLVPDLFIHIKVDDEECVKRIAGRRLDPETGNVYHIEFNPPPDDIKSRVIQRKDDSEEVIRKRLADYHSQADSVQSYFKDVYAEVDGTGGIAEASRQIGAQIVGLLAGRQ